MILSDEINNTNFDLYCESRQSNIYTVYIYGTIGQLSKYTEIIYRLQNADINDIFNFNINSDGGILDTGISLIDAIQTSKAEITCRVVNEVSSLATLIALSCPKIKVSKFVVFMFHNFSGDVSGKGNEMGSRIIADINYYTDIFLTITNKFLTKIEQQSILTGQDIYLTRADIIPRLQKMGKYIED